MNTYDKYAEMTEDQQWRYVEGLQCEGNCDCESECNNSAMRGDRNFELEQLNSEIKAKDRKNTPVFSGVLKYFPNALKEVAKCSKAGNDQHHPDKPLHWDMSKSKDEYDALTRHLIDHTINPMDDDGVLHLAKVAWRALAGLERYLTNKQ